MSRAPDLTGLKARFGGAVERTAVSCGDTIAWIQKDKVHEALAWLKGDQGYDYLVDITAVEYRDPELPLEIVWNLRSLRTAIDLRIKVALDPTKPLEVPTVTDLWLGADWLEREVYDMFGVTFRGHPDLRRLLMWETYHEGHPLRKGFPLRGHFSRGEQTRQALAANPEAHYSLEELSIAEAYDDLPQSMRERLARGERGDV
jgi:NADH-quinone oxidoreductase subunit C